MKKILLMTLILVFLLQGISLAEFNDLSSVHWAYGQIMSMKAKGILDGYPDGSFNPDGKVTREQFSKILVTGLGLKDNGEKFTFSDVEESRWSKEYIGIAGKYLEGYTYNGKNFFNPTNSAIRQDVATALVKALNLEKEAADLDFIYRFSDYSDMSSEEKFFIALAVEYGLMNGNADNSFNPKGELTRAEAATLMMNAIKLNERLISEKSDTTSPIIYNMIISKNNQKISKYRDTTYKPQKGENFIDVDISFGNVDIKNFSEKNKIKIELKADGEETKTIYALNGFDNQDTKVVEFGYRFDISNFINKKITINTYYNNILFDIRTLIIENNEHAHLFNKDTLKCECGQELNIIDANINGVSLVNDDTIYLYNPNKISILLNELPNIEGSSSFECVLLSADETAKNSFFVTPQKTEGGYLYEVNFDLRMLEKAGIDFKNKYSVLEIRINDVLIDNYLIYITVENNIDLDTGWSVKSSRRIITNLKPSEDGNIYYIAKLGDTIFYKGKEQYKCDTLDFSYWEKEISDENTIYILGEKAFSAKKENGKWILINSLYWFERDVYFDTSEDYIHSSYALEAYIKLTGDSKASIKVEDRKAYYTNSKGNDFLLPNSKIEGAIAYIYIPDIAKAALAWYED